MKKMFILLKNNFIRKLNINKLKSIKISKLILYGFIVLYALASVFISVFFYANAIADALLKYNLISYMLVLYILISAFANFTFTIHSSKESLFSSKDNDLLFSLPLKSSTILASRIINIIFWNLITSLLILGPAMIVYINKVNVEFQFYIFSFIIFVLLPIIPTILASAIGYVIAYFTSKSNKKNFFEIILSLALFFAIYYFTYNGEKILSLFINNKEYIEKTIKYLFYPIYVGIEALNQYNYIYLLGYILINIIFMYIFVYVLKNRYTNIVYKLQENKTKSNYDMSELKSKGQMNALLTKEIKKYFSSPIYVLNTIFGVILFFIFAIATLFMDKEIMLGMLGFSSDGFTFFQMIYFGLIFIVGLSVTTSVSISMEGNNYWIIKSSPVNKKKYFNSKILLNIIVTIPVIWISLIVLKFSTNLSAYEFIILAIFSLLMTIFSSMTGLIINLLFPKMNAANDVEIVKRSLSVILSIITQLILMVLIIYSYSFFGIDFNTMTYIILALIIVFIIIEKILIEKWGEGRLDSIN